MSFRDQMQADMDIALAADSDSESATYYPKGKDYNAISINADFAYGSTGVQTEKDGDWSERTAVVLVSKTNVPVVTPREDYISNSDGDDFFVKEITNEDHASYTLDCIKSNRKSVGTILRKG